MKGISLSIFFLCMIGFCHLFSHPVLAEGTQQRYFTALPDIPLIDGMVEIEDKTFVFDKAEGSIIETVGFLSANKAKDILENYTNILIKMGWKPTKTGAFRRNHEQLLLKTAVSDKGTLLTFELSPMSR